MKSKTTKDNMYYNGSAWVYRDPTPHEIKPYIKPKFSLKAWLLGLAEVILRFVGWLFMCWVIYKIWTFIPLPMLTGRY